MKRNITVHEKDELIRLMREDYLDKGMTLREIGYKYGRSHQTIADKLSPLTKEDAIKHKQNYLMRMYNKLSTKPLDSSQ